MRNQSTVGIMSFAVVIILASFIVSACTAPVVQRELDEPAYTTFPSTAAEEFPPAPVLRLETGMHTSMVNRIDIDRNQQFLVTGSEDKTVRVWEADTGRLLHVLRVPLGKGYLGRIFCVAISPDGATVAAGGWTGSNQSGGQSIYIFDHQSGEIRYVIDGLPNVITHLRFSPDGGVSCGEPGSFKWFADL